MKPVLRLSYVAGSIRPHLLVIIGEEGTSVCIDISSDQYASLIRLGITEWVR